MTDRRSTVTRIDAMPYVGRWLLITAAAILLCSCRGLDPQAMRSASLTASGEPEAVDSISNRVNQPPSTAVTSDAHLSDLADRPVATVSQTTDVVQAVLPPMMMAQAPAVSPVPQAVIQSVPSGASGYPCFPTPLPCPPAAGPPGCPHGLGCGDWTPPGLVCPWPQDEYLCDGGDKRPAVRVRSDWSVQGLDLEDTVVHYDTLDGQTRVEPSNRVCLYAPRFAAVRKVYGIVQHEGHEYASRLDQPTALVGVGDVQQATTTVQPLQPALNRGLNAASGFRDQALSTMIENSAALMGAHGGLLPYEDFTIIRDGSLDNSEKARLAQRAEAALAWSHDAAVQVVIDNVTAHEDAGATTAGSVHTYSMHGKSRLQVCKIASRKDAQPGETVDFTLRFDNVGDQVIGNVTVIDNLTTRLEYVDGSQSCTLKANFAASDNQGESLSLRWEVVEPMKVGTGGVIRFQCRVR